MAIILVIGGFHVEITQSEVSSLLVCPEMILNMFPFSVVVILQSVKIYHTAHDFYNLLLQLTSRLKDLCMCHWYIVEYFILKMICVYTTTIGDIIFETACKNEFYIWWSYVAISMKYEQPVKQLFSKRPVGGAKWYIQTPKNNFILILFRRLYLHPSFTYKERVSYDDCICLVTLPSLVGIYSIYCLPDSALCNSF